MQTETSGPKTQIIQATPLQAPHAKLQRGWPTTSPGTGNHAETPYPQQENQPALPQTTNQEHAGNHPPEAQHTSWIVIGIAGVALAIAFSAAMLAT